MEHPSRITRRYPRIQCDLPMFVDQIGDGRFQGFSRTKVLGEGGCMFLSPKRVGYLALVEVSISAGGKVVRADGRVVYERSLQPQQVEVGIEFVRLSPADRSHLRTLCAAPSASP
jgi:hypothetical protein